MNKPPAAVPATASAPVEIEISLYEVRKKIYPRAIHGMFAGWRWALVWFTQLLFYGVPWLTWNARPAVLFDLEARRFYLFGVVLYPQDFVYLTGLLVISALSLFLFTAVAGRLWCGFACPQTVYTEIFMWIERKVEGDRNARMKLDRAPFSAAKLARKGTKQLLWIALALWTGIMLCTCPTLRMRWCSRAYSRAVSWISRPSRTTVRVRGSSDSPPADRAAGRSGCLLYTSDAADE